MHYLEIYKVFNRSVKRPSRKVVGIHGGMLFVLRKKLRRRKREFVESFAELSFREKLFDVFIDELFGGQSAFLDGCRIAYEKESVADV